MNNLFAIKERLASVRWLTLLEQRGQLVGLFNRIQLVVFGRLVRENCLAIISIVKFIQNLNRKSGALFTSQYRM